MKNFISLVLIFLSLGCQADKTCSNFIDKWSKISAQTEVEKSYLEYIVKFNKKYGPVKNVFDNIISNRLNGDELNILISQYGHYLLNQSIVTKHYQITDQLLRKGVSLFGRNTILNAPILEVALNKDNIQIEIIKAHVLESESQVISDIEYYINHCKGRLNVGAK